MELAMYVTAYCDGAFLCNGEYIGGGSREWHLPLAARSTHPGVLRGPVVQPMSEDATFCNFSARASSAYLVA